jgi:tRNA(fMet)-specific endonuclease VapC
VSYLLDTNACIVLINGTSDVLRGKFDRVATAGDRLYISSLVMFELWYGVYKSSRAEFNSQRLNTFLKGPITLLEFDENDARSAASVRAVLKRKGKPIGSYDVLLAGQAICRRLTLVTANVSEFSRVKELVWQDWANS